jgi:UDP-N-acetylglucosamine:LPS N-acetylglucosamine transferase
LRKYLFLYLKTGGGHLAPAKAVAEKIRSKHKADVEIVLEDGLSRSRSFLRKILVDGYRTSVNQALWAFEFLYALHKVPVVSRITSSVICFFIKPGIEKLILETKPAKIVIFHFFLIKAVNSTLQKHNLDIPVVTVVTDPFTAHPIWFQQKGQKYIVFSEMLKEKCIKRGIDKENLKVFPFVLSQKFSRKVSKSKALRIREELGFKADTKIILIMGGGDGIPKGRTILKHIISSNINAEIAVVCGNNIKMYDYVIELQEIYKFDNVKVYGFVEFIHSLINISEVVITKCGASSFMEILLSGKVPLINNYIWEQEKGNMEFVCNNGMGIYERKPEKLSGIVNRLLNDGKYYESLTGMIRKNKMKNGVEQVTEYILNFN